MAICNKDGMCTRGIRFLWAEHGGGWSSSHNFILTVYKKDEIFRNEGQYAVIYIVCVRYVYFWLLQFVCVLCVYNNAACLTILYYENVVKHILYYEK